MTRMTPIRILFLLLLLLALAACGPRDLGTTEAPDLDAGGQPTLSVPTPAADQPTPEPTADGAQPTVDAGGETPVDQPTQEAGTDGSGEPVATDPTPDPATPTEQVHTVASGETVGTIAQQYGVTIEDIVVANELPNPNVIAAGQQLRIVPGAAAGVGGDGGGTDAGGSDTTTDPGGFDPNNYREHVVRFGETLFSIGQLYGFTVDELATYNSIPDPTRIDAGQIIRIPLR